jgi:hypothetical protein
VATQLLRLTQELLSCPARARPANPIRAALNVNACPPSPIVSSPCEVTVLIEGVLGSEVQTAGDTSKAPSGELVREAGIAHSAPLVHLKRRHQRAPRLTTTTARPSAATQPTISHAEAST